MKFVFFKPMTQIITPGQLYIIAFLEKNVYRSKDAYSTKGRAHR